MTTDTSTPRTVRMSITRTWFDAIATGEKTIEYRRAKPYWSTRLTFPAADRIELTNDIPDDVRRFLGITLPDTPVFAIHLGRILWTSHWPGPADDIETLAHITLTYDVAGTQCYAAHCPELDLTTDEDGQPEDVLHDLANRIEDARRLVNECTPDPSDSPDEASEKADNLTLVHNPDWYHKWK